MVYIFHDYDDLSKLSNLENIKLSDLESDESNEEGEEEGEAPPFILDPSDSENLDNDKLQFNSQQVIIYNTAKEESNKKYIVPALKCEVTTYNKNTKKEEVVTRYVVYDQFNTRIERKEETFNKDDLKLGLDVFKYYVSDSDITFNFDVHSYPGVKLQYQIFRRPDNCQYEVGTDQDLQVKLDNTCLTYKDPGYTEVYKD